jgi:hypothetical protein
MRVIKSRIKRAKQVARMGKMRSAYTTTVGKPEGKIILKWILKKLGVDYGFVLDSVG